MVFERLCRMLALLLLSQASFATGTTGATSTTTPGAQDVATTSSEPRSSACANARTPTDKAAYELAQMRAIGAYLRQSRGVVSGQESVVRDDASVSVLKTAVAGARVAERMVKTTATGQLQVCVEMVFTPN